MAEWSIVFSISLVALVVILGGVMVGFWITRAQEQSAAGQSAPELEGPVSSADAASQASGTFADELLAEKLRLYSRVLQENGRVFEALAAVGVAGGVRQRKIRWPSETHSVRSAKRLPGCVAYCPGWI